MNNIVIIGAGTMGQGIAQVIVQAGYEVMLYDPQPNALENAKRKLKALFLSLEAKQRLKVPAEDLLHSIHFLSKLDGLEAVTWLIEAAPENLSVKQEIFKMLDERFASAILTSNTSSFSITQLARVTQKPERVIGLHFFNPAALMALVEIIPGAATDQTTLDKTKRFVKALGKTPVIAKDAPGFIVNRVARPFYGEALYLHAEGIPIELIDQVMRGLGFAMGPFELMDLIGIDINYAASKTVYEAFFQAPRFRPHPIQSQKVQAGLLGKKTQQGFYSYPRPNVSRPKPRSPKTKPKAFFKGPSYLVQQFQTHLSATDSLEHADLILDFAPDEASQTVPSIALVWSNSASLSGYDVGFSTVPPLDKNIIELYPALGKKTSATLALAQTYFHAHGFKTLVLPDTVGGIGFRIVGMIINEAIYALAESLASASDIDIAMTLGTRYPKGPLAWSEHLGLDQVLKGLEGIFEELADERYKPHPLLKRAVAMGLKTWQEISGV